MKMKKSVAIELDKVRNLRYGVNQLCILEESIGKPVTELSKGAGIRELRGLLYAGLSWEDNSLTLERAGEILEEVLENKGTDQITEKISEALALALGDSKK